MENSMEASRQTNKQKTKIELAYDPAILLLSVCVCVCIYIYIYIARERESAQNKNSNSKKYMHPNVQSNISYNCQYGRNL